MKNKKTLFIILLLTLGIGFLSGFLTKNNTSIYEVLNKPELSPPGFIFPIVWTILFILMGFSAYLIYTSNKNNKVALTLYVIQLIVNFFWSIIFFNLKCYLFSFIWLILLLALIIITAIYFYNINKKAAYLLVPYIIWISYAGYLNLGIYLLNR